MHSLMDRRRLLQTLGAALALAPGSRARPGLRASWRMPVEEAGTPKICLGFYMPVDDANIRKVKQIGVDHVLMGGPGFPGTRPRSARGSIGSRPAGSRSST